MDATETTDAGDTPPGEDTRDVPGIDGDAGDAIYGAAKASLSRTAMPFIWNETGLSFPERPNEVPAYYSGGLGDVDSDAMISVNYQGVLVNYDSIP